MRGVAFTGVAVMLFTTSVVLVEGQTLINGNDASTNVCYSSTGSMRIGTVSLASPSSERVIMFDTLAAAPIITISCVNILVVSSAAAAPAKDPACAAPNVLYLCHASSPSAGDWVCEQLSEYVYANTVTVSRGSSTDPSWTWRLELQIGAKAAYCFPRQIQMVAIVGTTDRSTGSLTLLVIVGIVLGMVVICFGVFAFYALRKHAARLQRESDSAVVQLPPGMNPPPVLPGVEGQYPPQPLPVAEVRALYLLTPHAATHHITADGIITPRYLPHDHFDKHVEMTQRSFAFESRKQSVYERALENGGFGDLSGVKDPVREWSPTDHPDALEPMTAIPISILERAEKSPRRYNPIRDADLDKAISCADCGVVVQDAATPKYCSRTGKRHY